MNTLFLVISVVFVISVLAVVAFLLFELTPFVRHKDHYRDPASGKRRFESPRLD